MVNWYDAICAACHLRYEFIEELIDRSGVIPEPTWEAVVTPCRFVEASTRPIHESILDALEISSLLEYASVAVAISELFAETVDTTLPSSARAEVLADNETCDGCDSTADAAAVNWFTVASDVNLVLFVTEARPVISVSRVVIARAVQNRIMVIYLVTFDSLFPMRKRLHTECRWLRCSGHCGARSRIVRGHSAADRRVDNYLREIAQWF